MSHVEGTAEQNQRRSLCGVRRTRSHMALGSQQASDARRPMFCVTHMWQQVKGTHVSALDRKSLNGSMQVQIYSEEGHVCNVQGAVAGTHMERMPSLLGTELVCIVH